MAVLRQGSLFRVISETELLIGRSEVSSWKLSSAYVSSQHAVLRWDRDRWQVRDLGSRNGTFVDRQRIVSGEFRPLEQGACLAFGDEAQSWILADAGPPRCAAMPLDGGEPLLIEDGVLEFMDPGECLATILCDCNGSWVLEQPGRATLPLAHGSHFAIKGRRFRFSCPEANGPTVPSAGAEAQLCFTVSRDEEYVGLRVMHGDTVLEMGSRTQNYMLLTLARSRLSDLNRGLPLAESGWVYQDELAQGLRINLNQLNVDVYRIRQHFARSGASTLLNAIERRPPSKQLRIGTARLVIQVA